MKTTCFLFIFVSLGLRAQVPYSLVVFQSKEGLYGYENATTGEVIVSPKYRFAAPFQGGFAAVQFPNGKWGYVNQRGREIVGAVYDGATDFKEGYAAVCNGCIADLANHQFHGGKWGFINQYGSLVIPLKYDDAQGFSEGLASVCIGCYVEIVKKEDDVGHFGVIRHSGNRGYINTADEEVIPFQYEEALPFSEGLALVRKNNKFMYLSKEGLIVSNQYDWGESVVGGIAKVKRENKFGLINNKGKEILPAEYDLISDFHEGFAFVCKGCQKIDFEKGNYGVISLSGKLVIPAVYKKIKNFSHELFKVYTHDKKQGFINKYNNEEPLMFDEADDFVSDGFVHVKKNGKFGIMDETGRLLTECKYDKIDDFSDGMAKAKIGEQFLFINNEGKELLLKNQYEQVSNFRNGFAAVRKNNKWGYINKAGEEKIKPEYDKITPYGFSEGLAAVYKYGKWGFVNTDGEIVIPFQYDEVEEFINGTAYVKKENKSFYIDKEGKCVNLCN
ncbi:MAG: WG repeat-containing protein [Cytophagales bacterium]|nr:WG repeat-containing protein [Cytophagales bacterium]MDW8383996.1 WG repeat-containing protein [Flammeovirgaceae bacterium]